MHRLLAALVAVLAVLLGSLTASPAAAAPVDDYADYQGQTRCRPKAKQGTKLFARWLVRRHGGGYGAISRRCRIGGASEHKEGRAFDWAVDVRRKADRRRVNRFLRRVFATGASGERHALARRMGIMYVIWDDHIYASYDRFRKRDYLSGACRSKRRCSRTLRHRDHVHVSLSRRGGRARTSWYVARLAR